MPEAVAGVADDVVAPPLVAGVPLAGACVAWAGLAPPDVEVVPGVVVAEDALPGSFGA